jgi:hypothetical protein
MGCFKIFVKIVQVFQLENKPFRDTQKRIAVEKVTTEKFENATIRTMARKVSCQWVRTPWEPDQRASSFGSKASAVIDSGWTFGSQNLETS